MAKQQQHQAKTAKEPKFIQPTEVPPDRPEKCPDGHEITWSYYSGVGICLLHPGHPGIWVYDSGHVRPATDPTTFRLGLDVSHWLLEAARMQVKTNQRLGQLHLARQTLGRALDALEPLRADDVPSRTLRQDIVAFMQATNDLEPFPINLDYVGLADDLEREY
jgi:hypothetical protein